MTELAWEDEGAHGGLMSRRSNASCLTEREIEEFLFNRLSGVTREVVEEHLLVCQECLDKVEQEESYFEVIRAEARLVEEQALERSFTSVPKQGFIQRWVARFSSFFDWGNRRLWIVAAACLLVVSSGVLWQSQMNRQPAFQEVSLEVHRGAFLSAESRAGLPLSLAIAVEDLPAGTYSMQLVDSSGQPLATAESTVSNGRLQWKLRDEFPAGTYWIRLRRPGNSTDVVREFGLKLVR